MRPISVLYFVLFLTIGCSGSGATVADSSSSDNEVSAPSVEPSTPVDPVRPTSVTTFECKTSEALSDGSIHTIRFTLRGDVLEPEVSIEPPSSPLAALAKATVERKSGKLVLLTESRTELGLFENSDLTRGYVKADGGEYSDLYCTKR